MYDAGSLIRNNGISIVNINGVMLIPIQRILTPVKKPKITGSNA
jgi:hypothetical protein